ncbi:MAG: hypothetical protein C4K47_04405 [Candidatus Thorarchaeota archaeon]|nr:MAG: hypothetical protein C4K47_04405 [Candidatus Thorarchaeota archaeon]
MAIEVYVAAEFLMFVSLIAASFAIAGYTRRRIRELPEEDKKLGKPLYAYAAGTFVMGITSFANYLAGTQVVIGPWAWRFWPSYAYVVLAILAPAFISIAALIVLGREHFMIPTLFALVLVSYVWILPMIPNPIDARDATADVSSVMYIPAVLLFGYILAKTRKATSLGLFYVVTFYPLYRLTVIGLSAGPVDLSIVFLALRLLAPVIAAVAFQVRDIGISFELAGYGMAYALIAFWLSYLMISPVTDPVLIASLTLIALGSTIGFGTGAYTYARWKKNRLGATFVLFLSFTFTTWAFILVALQGLGLATAIYYTYAYIFLTFIALMCFNMAAYLALEWRSLLLLPVLMILPLLFFLSIQYPSDPRLNPFFIPAISITGVVAAIVPVALYLYLWQRMRQAKAPAASRPLLLATGILGLTLALAAGPITMGTEVLNVANPISGVLTFIAFLAWWLAVTGRNERFMKWLHSTFLKPKPAPSTPPPAGAASQPGGA